LGPTGVLKRRQQRLKKLEEWHVRERRAKEREANQRVLALKSHNYEEYLRLAASAKDQRLKKLMDTTDDIMRNLRQKVGERVQGDTSLFEGVVETLHPRQ
jgi:hypothetical protein